MYFTPECSIFYGPHNICSIQRHNDTPLSVLLCFGHERPRTQKVQCHRMTWTVRRPRLHLVRFGQVSATTRRSTNMKNRTLCIMTFTISNPANISTHVWSSTQSLHFYVLHIYCRASENIDRWICVFPGAPDDVISIVLYLTRPFHTPQA